MILNARENGFGLCVMVWAWKIFGFGLRNSYSNVLRHRAAAMTVLRWSWVDCVSSWLYSRVYAGDVLGR